MKKRILFFAASVTLTGVGLYYFFVRSQTVSTPFGWEGNFTVKDTASVQRIFLADANGQNILLERTENGWMLDKKDPANDKAVRYFLETLTKLAVKTPVSKSNKETVIKKIASSHVKTEIYQQSKGLTKVLYVGGPTPGHDGSYMLLESPHHGKASKPYIVEITGFRGFPTPRFHVIKDDWKDKTITKLEENNIKSVELIHTTNPSASFKIIGKPKGNKKEWKLLSADGKEVNGVDTMAVRNFLTNFQYLSYEKTLNHINKKNFSSPLFVLTIQPENRKNVVLEIYSLIKQDGNEDPNRFLAIMNNSEVVSVQFFTFKNVLISKNNLLQLTGY